MRHNCSAICLMLQLCKFRLQRNRASIPKIIIDGPFTVGYFGLKCSTSLGGQAFPIEGLPRSLSENKPLEVRSSSPTGS